MTLILITAVHGHATRGRLHCVMYIQNVLFIYLIMHGRANYSLLGNMLNYDKINIKIQIYRINENINVSKESNNIFMFQNSVYL